MTCLNCGKPIEKIIDPWGYDNRRGSKYGFFHPDLVDGSTDCPDSGTLCADRENFAEAA